MKIAVTMSTFRRKDGRTPFYLKRALDSVFTQTHQDFKVFLIGDEYEDLNELFSICCNYPKDKLKVINIKEAKERRKYLPLEDKHILWSCAGVTAINVAITKALEEDIFYISHLDHDDYWHKTHLRQINNLLEKGASFVCSKSKYGQFGILPTTDFGANKVVPYLPQPGQIINSSTCFNYKDIPLLYRNMFEICGQPIPADADLWDRMNNHIQSNCLRSYLINRITCFHTEEGYILYGGR